MATAGAHPNAGHAPDARCVFPEQTPRNVSGVPEPAFSGFSRRSSGSRRPRALDYRPPRRGNPPTPASSAFDRRAPRAFKTRACARGCARRASRRRRDRPFRARRRMRARPRSWRRGRARGDAVGGAIALRGARPGVASRFAGTVSSGNFQRLERTATGVQSALDRCRGVFLLDGRFFLTRAFFTFFSTRRVETKVETDD